MDPSSFEPEEEEEEEEEASALCLPYLFKSYSSGILNMAKQVSRSGVKRAQNVMPMRNSAIPF